ncbi:hypothetical protein G9A89_006166 [Geosiphon pyriformis]|nr:hypothetical protein G9A89_006166 [Geosiphon pyriformis]
MGIIRGKRGKKKLGIRNPEFQTPTNPNLENSENTTLNIQILQNPEPINQPNLPPLNSFSSHFNYHFNKINNCFNNPMAYTPIAKLDNFTGKEDDAQVWLNDVEKAITANGWNDVRAIQAISYFLKDITNSWYQSLINKPQDFNAFKVEFLRYFSNNNSINCLVNMFTIMKQGETEAVTTYLKHFHRNLHQIQAIDANYFTAPQILNQFIHGLCSSILQHVRPLYPNTLQNAVTPINLVMNGSSELDSKLEKFSESINKRLEEYLADNHTIYQPPQ